MNLQPECRRFEEGLGEVLVGETSVAESTRLAAHEAACPDCAALAALRRDLLGFPLEEAGVPEVLVGELWPAVRRALRARRRPRRVRSWLLAAALISMLLNLALGLSLRAGLTREDRLFALLAAEREIPAPLRLPAGGGRIGRRLGARAESLRASLSSLPPGTLLFDAETAARLRADLDDMGYTGLPAGLDRRLADGLDAEDLSWLLEQQRTDPAARIPVEWLRHIDASPHRF